MTANPTIAAIIPTFRRWPHLLATVQQLMDQSRVPDEIIIIDQTPQSEIDAHQLRQLDRYADRCRRLIYRHQAQAHVYRARNAAARLAASDLLLYLDDDVILDRQLVEHHMSILEDESIDAVAGRVIRRGIDTAHRPPPLRDASPVARAYQFGVYRDDVRLENVAHCPAGHFCVRRRVLEEVGGWDEHILTYGDKDMGLRLHASGKKIVYDPRPELVHLAAPTGGSRLTDPRSPWPAWQRAVSIHYVALRHLRGADFWRYGMVRAAQHTFLLRRNAMRPWRWVPEMWGYAKGFVIAWVWSRHGVLSSYPAWKRSATRRSSCH